MSSQIQTIKKHLEYGINGAFTFRLKDILLDPEGYTAQIDEQELAVTAVQEGPHVVIAIPIAAGVFKRGDYSGYWHSNSPNEGSYVQVKLALSITKKLG